MEDSHHSLDIAISGMSCASCVNAVESALRKIPEVKSASVNLATEKAHVELLEGVSFQTQDIIKAVNAAGYGAELLTQNRSLSHHDDESANDIR
ncbi:MAG: heavy metal-associated domain-containing protein, partial [Methylophilaceae bacterium]